MLQSVEIGLRNWLDKAIAQHLANTHPNPTRWLMDPPIWMHSNELDVMENAKDKLAEQVRKGTRNAYGHNDMVATASFSLWSNMIQNNQVWVALTYYKQGTLTRDIKRKELHKIFDDIRNLRNRAYHLEPIFCQADLLEVYRNAVKYLNILDPRLANLMKSLDRFESIFEGGDGWKTLRAELYRHYSLDQLEETE